MAYQSYLYVFVIIIFLNSLQNTAVSGQNIGLMMRNFTHLPTNETCGSRGANCKYYMDLCFSFSKKLDCSIFTLKTFSWVVRPGESKIFNLGTDVATNIGNPLRVSLEKWKKQEVVLQANISKSGTPPIFIERIHIEGRLPYPINKISKLQDQNWEKITECGSQFCLVVTFYMWCDDINGCVAIFPTTSIPPTTTRITPSTSKQEITQTASTMERTRTSTISKPEISSTIIKVETQPSTVPPVTSIRPSVSENPESAKTYSETNVAKFWWFWFIMVLVVLFILLLGVMVIRREMRRSGRVSVTTRSKYNHGNDKQEHDTCGKDEITMNPLNAL